MLLNAHEAQHFFTSMPNLFTAWRISNIFFLFFDIIPVFFSSTLCVSQTQCKYKHKKKVYEETSYTSKGISKGSKGIPKS